ncbi:MAG: CRTAC1 family protein [Myxococcota bacterium]
MLLSWLLACGTDVAVDSGPAVADGPSGFTLGDVVACDAGGPPTWTEDPTPPEVYTVTSERGHEPGAVAVVDVAGTPWLVWAPPWSGVRARPLAGGSSSQLDARMAHGITQADLDGDGAVEVLLTREDLTIVWGMGTADQRVLSLSVEEGETVRDVAVADVDGDSHLDLVLAFSHPDHDDIEALRGEVRFGGNGRRFRRVVPIEGDDDVWGPAFDLTVFDRDADARPDVYLCNDFGATAAPNVVLANEGGMLVPAEDGAGLDIRTSCMGSAFGDVSADGRLDAFVVSTPVSFVLEGSPGGWYDASAARALPSIDLPHMGWGAVIEDLDNDGDGDVLMGASDFYSETMTPFPMFWYRQAADGTFTDAAAEAGFPQEAHTRAVVARDLNGDGVLDLVVSDALRSPWVFWSDGCSEGAWLAIDAPYGSQVVVRAGDRAWAAQVTSDSAWAASGPPRAHIGLGDLLEVDAVEITPPWGETVVLDGPIAARRVVTWAPP